MWLLGQKPLFIEVRLALSLCKILLLGEHWTQGTLNWVSWVCKGRTESVWNPVKGWRSQMAGQREMLKCICLLLVVIDENGFIMSSEMAATVCWLNTMVLKVSTGRFFLCTTVGAFSAGG